ncbi:winged helix-turn-helix transcriptional regulator [Candidatus Gracilibacteria bacterium]|nr:winged helix-turn-helix transcriptional regulator [Candidatus Gracilibacteria bacterium]
MENLKELEKKTEEVAGLLKLLAHPKRFMLLCRLREGPKTVGDLEEYCAIGQSQLSQFLGKMKDEDILTCEKNGQYVSYSIADPRVIELMNQMQTIFCKK